MVLLNILHGKIKGRIHAQLTKPDLLCCFAIACQQINMWNTVCSIITANLMPTFSNPDAQAHHKTNHNAFSCNKLNYTFNVFG